MLNAAVILVLFVASTTGTASVDLALKKPAFQIDTAYGGLASRAVDANYDSSYWHKHCSHTNIHNDDGNNWWAVDLGQQSTIEKVVLHNRADCCASRLANFDIVVTNEKPTPGCKISYSKAQVCSHKTGAVKSGAAESFPCKAEGRYVAIVQPRRVYLTLCGVQVFGHPGVASTDLALKKPAFQIDTAYGGLASRAVDANYDSSYWHKHCSHTNIHNDDGKNWWAVDLGQPSTIAKVVLHNRADCCATRLANFDIVVTNKKPTPGHQLVYSKAQVCSHKTGSVKSGAAESFPCKAEGRYVAIAQPRRVYLTLCGVQVFGHPGVDTVAPCVKA